MSEQAPVGVFDSGIGGLTVVKELIRMLPDEDIIYFGDTARTPYGCRPPTEILTFMDEILQFFTVQKVKMAVVACNTMTALGVDSARQRYHFPLVGVNTGMRAALAVSRNKKIGVIATQATVDSGKHCMAAREIDTEAVVYAQPCPQFVPLIEQEHFTGKLIEQVALEYLWPLKEAQVDALVLGCTHYPFIQPLISRIMGPGVTIIDPARETARDAKDMLARTGQLSTVRQRGRCRLGFSADICRAERIARHILANDGVIPEFELIRLRESAAF